MVGMSIIVARFNALDSASWVGVVYNIILFHKDFDFRRREKLYHSIQNKLLITATVKSTARLR